MLAQEGRKAATQEVRTAVDMKGLTAIKRRSEGIVKVVALRIRSRRCLGCPTVAVIQTPVSPFGRFRCFRLGERVRVDERAERDQLPRGTMSQRAKIVGAWRRTCGKYRGRSALGLRQTWHKACKRTNSDRVRNLRFELSGLGASRAV